MKGDILLHVKAAVFHLMIVYGGFYCKAPKSTIILVHMTTVQCKSSEAIYIYIKITFIYFNYMENFIFPNI